ncbi:MAG TPA: hypothetical protein ENN98_00485 [Desulfurivibrio alkaliphilus]|uniref:FeoB-associated Cys-rich membrane protein n=1 Tax=Desulfurivibrio alkaliphilus TaxID=427923 RepID=A0A7C2TIG3_9BACT|nr:hypothetical protein [Desulfurivibrio alkaliphilus]
MIWEYLIIAVVLGWAGYYLWRVLLGRKGGCSCGAACGAEGKCSCGDSQGQGCGGRPPGEGPPPP